MIGGMKMRTATAYPDRSDKKSMHTSEKIAVRPSVSPLNLQFG